MKDEYDAQFLKALDGFVMLLDGDGEMLYLSDNVHKHLGLTQVSHTHGTHIYTHKAPTWVGSAACRKFLDVVLYPFDFGFVIVLFGSV